jgi:hypothetical protein
MIPWAEPSLRSWPKILLNRLLGRARAQFTAADRGSYRGRSRQIEVADFTADLRSRWTRNCNFIWTTTVGRQTRRSVAFSTSECADNLIDSIRAAPLNWESSGRNQTWAVVRTGHQINARAVRSLEIKVEEARGNCWRTLNDARWPAAPHLPRNPSHAAQRSVGYQLPISPEPDRMSQSEPVMDVHGHSQVRDGHRTKARYGRLSKDTREGPQSQPSRLHKHLQTPESRREKLLRCASICAPPNESRTAVRRLASSRTWTSHKRCPDQKLLGTATDPVQI